MPCGATYAEHYRAQRLQMLSAARQVLQSYGRAGLDCQRTKRICYPPGVPIEAFYGREAGSSTVEYCPFQFPRNVLEELALHCEGHARYKAIGDERVGRCKTYGTKYVVL